MKNVNANVFYNYLEYSKSIGLIPSTIETMLIGANEQVYQRILTSCSHVTELRVHLFDDFQFDGFAEYTVDDFRLYIPGQNINWFTVDHMCALINCRSVLVYHINWESEDFNEFLQFWMVSNGRLQSLTLWGQWSPTPDNLQDLFDEIDHREIIRRLESLKRQLKSYSELDLVQFENEKTEKGAEIRNLKKKWHEHVMTLNALDKKMQQQVLEQEAAMTKANSVVHLTTNVRDERNREIEELQKEIAKTRLKL